MTSSGRGPEEHGVPARASSKRSAAKGRRRPKPSKVRPEDWYRALFESMGDGLALHEVVRNPEGKPVDLRILDLNPAFESLTGLAGKQVVGRRLTEVLPDTAPGWIRSCVEVALTGRSARLEGYAPPGVCPAEVEAYCPSEGLVATVIRDTTMRESLEETRQRAARLNEALRRSRKDMQRAQEVSQVGSWRLDLDKNRLIWSDENHRIFGVPGRAPTTYESFLAIVHPDDREYVDTKWKAGLQGEPYDIDHRILVEGRVKWVREKAFLEFDREGRLLGGFGITQDITERKQAEEALRRDKEALELILSQRTKELMDAHLDLEQAKRLSDIGTLAATVAHELRNPLAAISAAVYNIEKKSGESKIGGNLDSIRRKVVESERIIGNLLFYSRLRPPTYEIIRPYEVIRDSVTEARRETCSRVRVLTDKLESTKDLTMEADGDQVREVLLNLINNAYEAIREEHGTIAVTAHRVGEALEIAVQDNGQGIDGQDLDKIYDPFFTTKAKGTGLGLSVCKQIVKLHGGSLAVESKRGAGTKVTVSFPLTRPLPADHSRTAD
jgi:PAS domain S-box-containing protein